MGIGGVAREFRVPVQPSLFARVHSGSEERTALEIFIVRDDRHFFSCLFICRRSNPSKQFLDGDLHRPCRQVIVQAALSQGGNNRRDDFRRGLHCIGFGARQRNGGGHKLFCALCSGCLWPLCPQCQLRKIQLPRREPRGAHFGFAPVGGACGERLFIFLHRFCAHHANPSARVAVAFHGGAFGALEHRDCPHFILSDASNFVAVVRQFHHLHYALRGHPVGHQGRRIADVGAFNGNGFYLNRSLFNHAKEVSRCPTFCGHVFRSCGLYFRSCSYVFRSRKYVFSFLQVCFFFLRPCFTFLRRVF